MSDLSLERGFEDYEAATNAQASAANPEQSAWVAANAGSGKTKVLIDRVARLLLGKAEPSSILCVTYTKAAANEMLGRLFKRLGSWSVMPEGELRDELKKLDPKTASYNEDDIQRARALFARALETPGGLRIETIHAFCSRILRRFPLEAKVAPGFQEMEDDDARELWEDAVKRAIKDAGREDPSALATLSLAGGAFGAKGAMNTLRGEAASLIAFASRHRQIDTAMAEAVRTALRARQTGTTEYLTSQLNLIDWDGLKAILPILHNDPASDDKRSAGLISQALDAKTPSKQWTALKRLFFTDAGKLRSRVYNAKSAKDPSVSALLSTKEPQGSAARITADTQTTLKAIEAAENTIALLRTGLPALEHYASLKSDQAALDFDDLIIKTRDLLTRTGIAAWVLYKLDGGLEHVLLDEAQDTSPHQWTLINALTEEFFAGLGTEREQNPRTLFVVGDEKQSIYSFQGADPQKFITERQIFSARSDSAGLPHDLPEMQMSFRSSPEILSFVDAVWNSTTISGPIDDKAPPSDAENTRHTAHRANEPGYVEFWPIDLPETDDDEDPWTPFSNLKALDELSSGSPKAVLANRIAEEVASMIERGDGVWEQGRGAKRAMHAGDVLILVRKRKGGLFDALIKSLKARGLPVAGADRLVLSDHIGVQDCLNLFRFVLLPSDDLTLAEILRGPFCNLVDDDAHLFPLAYDRPGTLWERLKDSTNPAHEDARNFILRLLEMHDQPAFEFLSAVLEQPISGDVTGWDKITARLGAPARDPIEALLARALAHDAQSATSLQLFVSDLEADESEIKRDLEEAGEAIRIMTVHGAKGLQAPVVILPDTTGKPDPKAGNFLYLSGDVPIRTGKKSDDTPEMAAARAIEEYKQLAEHRRLLYVALTRAQDRLLICGPWYGTKPKADKPMPGRPKGCWHEMCETGLRALGFEVPDVGGAPAHFGARPSPAEKAAPGDSELSQLPAWLRSKPPEEADTKRYAAPSSLSPGEAPVLSPFTKGHGSRLSRGRLIHALLERLPDIAPDERRAAGEAFLAANPNISASQCREMLGAALNVLEHPDFYEVFQPGGRAEAPVIGTSPDLPGDVILNGRVDRLVVTDKEVLVFDFKTDRPPPSKAEDVAISYIRQMAAYKAVLQQAYPHKSVKCALLWTDGPQLMELPENLLLDSLNSLRSGT